MLTRSKACPFCKEKIRRDAVKCRFCGEWLDVTTSHETTGHVAQPSQDEQTPVPASADALNSGTTDDSTKVVARALDEGATPQRPAIPPARDSMHPDGSQPDTPAREGTGKAPRQVKRSISGRTRTLISAGLLFASAAIMVIGLWDYFDASNLQKQTEAIGKVILPMLLVAVLCARSPRKGFNLLTFSLVSVLNTAILATYFRIAVPRHHGTKESADAARTFAQEMKSFFENGGADPIPTFKTTGDPEGDKFGKSMNDFLPAFAPIIATMRKELDAQRPKDVFDLSALASRNSLQAEIVKREERERIIGNTQSKLSDAINACRQRTSGERTDDTAVQGFSESFKTGLGLLERKEKAELDYVRFMVSAFDTYDVRDTIVFFHSINNSQRFDQLVESIKQKTGDLAGFQERASKEFNSIMK